MYNVFSPYQFQHRPTPTVYEKRRKGEHYHNIDARSGVVLYGVAYLPVVQPASIVPEDSAVLSTALVGVDYSSIVRPGSFVPNDGASVSVGCVSAIYSLVIVPGGDQSGSNFEAVAMVGVDYKLVISNGLDRNEIAAQSIGLQSVTYV